jgi:hypothetical protein
VLVAVLSPVIDVFGPTFEFGSVSNELFVNVSLTLAELFISDLLVVPLVLVEDSFTAELRDI